MIRSYPAWAWMLALAALPSAIKAQSSGAASSSFAQQQPNVATYPPQFSGAPAYPPPVYGAPPQVSAFSTTAAMPSAPVPHGLPLPQATQARDAATVSQGAPAAQATPALYAAPAGYGAPQVVYVPVPQPMLHDPAVTPAQYTVPGVPTAVPAAAPGGVAGCFSGLCAVGSKIKACYCKSPIGQMTTTIISPISGLTGGIIPSCCSNCAGDSPADKIKQDAAAAAARRAEVKYLGTVDCHWYPEAEMGLIGALRADRNECVRWEAAHQLGRGCCCTAKTIEALKICVEASNRDGNPSENSCRVRAEAYASLQVCLGCGTDGADAVRPEMPVPPESATPPVALHELNPYGTAVNYYRQEGFELARPQIVAEALQVCSRVRLSRSTSQPPRGQRSLMGIWSYAGKPRDANQQPTPAEGDLRPMPEAALAQTGDRRQNVPDPRLANPYVAVAPLPAPSQPTSSADAASALVRPLPGTSLYPSVATPTSYPQVPAPGAPREPVYQAELPGSTSRLPAMR